MDIFVQDVPHHITDKELRGSFVKPLRDLGMFDFHCHHPRGKPFAFITLLEHSAGQRFLSHYGVPGHGPRGLRQNKGPLCGGRLLRCQMSKEKPTEFAIGALKFEASIRMAEAVVTAPQDNKHTRKFDVARVHCGQWGYNESSQLTLNSHFTLTKPGKIVFGKREVILLLGEIGTDQVRMDVSYHSCDNIAVNEDRYSPTLTFTLRHSPKFYKVKGDDVLVAGMAALMMGYDAGRQTSIEKHRVLGFDEAHRNIAGACRVYQVVLSTSIMVSRVRGLLASSPKMPTHMCLTTSLQYPKVAFDRALRRLSTQLTDTAFYGKLPFQIRFQLDRVARNGYLPPLKVIELLPVVREVFNALNPEKRSKILAHALRQLTRSLPVPGPDTCEQYSIEHLATKLSELTDSYDHDAPNNPYGKFQGTYTIDLELVKRHQHINLVHRIIITPTRVALEGPDPEPTNRVLRLYPEHTDHFARVIFCDEDGGSVRYDPKASQRDIYDIKFSGVLSKPLIVAGMAYDFFGFANSALRNHSCWFMAPFPTGGTLFFASLVLKDLGNFDMIRIPAKCAARIGQNFTDTNETIKLSTDNVGELPVVTRNGYDFSDGVGTISTDLLKKVWKVYGTKRHLKPTALQIRFQGAKGMVSVDTRLEGEKMLLRSNMKKFETESSRMLEVCGAAFQPLPMFLNRQLIKILEDLGVSSQVFLDLQSDVIAKLRYMTESPVNTAFFLRQSVPQATKVSSLIEHLGEAGLDYHDDVFLYSVVELAVVTDLRDLKYRGRIAIEEGMTLYGIMDETGYLQEGEVFVITEQKGSSATSSASNGYLDLDATIPTGKQVLVNNRVIITRSPAMHPGDVQLVRAVDVPEDSPLQQLRNVVVFSQHGDRDLPSQLSGGDLDGDLYNVIYDRRFQSAQTYVAAQYPRLSPIELGRPVTARDMSDFFVRFMETDQLGMLCNVHMQLADQRSLGTLSPDCIKIAAMASTAVDYSKTGLAVDMKELPKHDRLRPDWMAPTPRVQLTDTGEVEVEELDDFFDDAFEGIDEERKPLRYYKSEKVLGQLYRNIDEKQFLADMHKYHNTRVQTVALSYGLTEKLCDYVLHHAEMYGVLYDHHLDFARDVRAGYEHSLHDILHQYEPMINMPLSEAEAFAGTILGRQGGAQGKPLRELSKTMRERFTAVAEYYTIRMIHGDAAIHEEEYLDNLYDLEEREIEAWPRTIACLVVACREVGLQDIRLGELKSFKYIAAASCLKEFERTRRGLGRYGSLPKCMF